MPNVLTANPVVITGVQPSYKAAVAASLGAFYNLRIEKVYWETPVTVGDTVTITDASGSQTILNLRCEVAAQSEIVDWSANPRYVADFAVPQISSGTLYIYLR